MVSVLVSGGLVPGVANPPESSDRTCNGIGSELQSIHGLTPLFPINSITRAMEPLVELEAEKQPNTIAVTVTRLYNGPPHPLQDS